MKPRDLRTYRLLCSYSVRRSFGSLKLAQDDSLGGIRKFGIAVNIFRSCKFLIYLAGALTERPNILSR